MAGLILGFGIRLGVETRDFGVCIAPFRDAQRGFGVRGWKRGLGGE